MGRISHDDFVFFLNWLATNNYTLLEAKYCYSSLTAGNNWGYDVKFEKTKIEEKRNTWEEVK